MFENADRDSAASTFAALRIYLSSMARLTCPIIASMVASGAPTSRCYSSALSAQPMPHGSSMVKRFHTSSPWRERVMTRLTSLLFGVHHRTHGIRPSAAINSAFARLSAVEEHLEHPLLRRFLKSCRRIFQWNDVRNQMIDTHFAGCEEFQCRLEAPTARTD
jgi:hypothetical protein